MWIAIVKHDENGRLEKYQVFDTELEADDHAAAYGGETAQWSGAEDVKHYRLVDGSLVLDKIPDVLISKDERYADYERSDIFQAMAKAMFEIMDRVVALEGKTPLSDETKKQWLKQKLIG